MLEVSKSPLLITIPMQATIVQTYLPSDGGCRRDSVLSEMRIYIDVYTSILLYPMNQMARFCETIELS